MTDTDREDAEDAAQQSAVSFAAEVIADSSGKWVGNGLRFSTPGESEAYVKDLMFRWTSVRETRTVPSQDPVTHVWADGMSAPVNRKEP